MLQDTQTIRFYQHLTDDMMDRWQRGFRYEDICSYLEGYLSCLRDSNLLEPYMIHRLEEDVFRFLRDPSNFELYMPQTQRERERDYY